MPAGALELTRAQADAVAVGQTHNFLFPGPGGPEVGLLVVLAMRGVTDPTVSAMDWNGQVLVKVAHVNNGDVSLEVWNLQNPNIGVFNLSWGPPSVVTSYTIEFFKTIGAGSRILVGSASGSGAGAPNVTLPTRVDGSCLDIINQTNFAGYAPNGGQGFINFGFVGVTAGFYEMTGKASGNPTTTMGGTTDAAAGAWIYAMIALLPPVLKQFRIASSGITARRRPVLAGVGWMDNLELELPDTIGAYVVMSNPLLVAGFNSFMLTISTLVAGVDVALFHCDPITLAILTPLTPLVVGSAPVGTPTEIGFGAFSPVVSDDTTGMDWYVVRLVMASDTLGVQSTLVYAQLFGGKR